MLFMSNTDFLLIHQQKVGYSQLGSGPKIVLIHGFGIDSQIWQPLTGLLKNHFTVISLDLRGYGLNKDMIGSVDLEGQVEFVRQFVEQIGAVSYILGYSYGGRVVFEYAKDPAPSIKKVFIVQTPFFKWRIVRLIKGLFQFSGKTAHLGKATKYIVTRSPLKEIILTLFGLIDISNQAVFDECVMRFLAEPNVTAVFRGTSHLFEPLNKTQLEKYIVPIHFVYSTNDKLARIGTIRRLLPLIKNSTLYQVENAFHLLPLEKPEELARTIIANQ